MVRVKFEQLYEIAGIRLHVDEKFGWLTGDDCDHVNSLVCN